MTPARRVRSYERHSKQWQEKQSQFLSCLPLEKAVGVARRLGLPKPRGRVKAGRMHGEG